MTESCRCREAADTSCEGCASGRVPQALKLAVLIHALSILALLGQLQARTTLEFIRQEWHDQGPRQLEEILSRARHAPAWEEVSLTAVADELQGASGVPVDVSERIADETVSMVLPRRSCLQLLNMIGDSVEGVCWRYVEGGVRLESTSEFFDALDSEVGIRSLSPQILDVVPRFRVVNGKGVLDVVGRIAWPQELRGGKSGIAFLYAPSPDGTCGEMWFLPVRVDGTYFCGIQDDVTTAPPLMGQDYKLSVRFALNGYGGGSEAYLAASSPTFVRGPLSPEPMAFCPDEARAALSGLMQMESPRSLSLLRDAFEGRPVDPSVPGGPEGALSSALVRGDPEELTCLLALYGFPRASLSMFAWRDGVPSCIRDLDLDFETLFVMAQVGAGGSLGQPGVTCGAECAYDFTPEAVRAMEWQQCWQRPNPDLGKALGILRTH